MIGQPHHPALLVTAPVVRDRARGRLVPSSSEFDRLRPFPRGQRTGQGVLRLRLRARHSTWRQPTQHLQDVPLPPQCLLQGGLRQSLQQGHRRQRHPARAVHDLEVVIGEQHRRRNSTRHFAHVRQGYRPARDRQNQPDLSVEPGPVPQQPDPPAESDAPSRPPRCRLDHRVGTQQPRGHVRHQGAGPQQMEEHRQHHQRITHPRGPRPQRPRLIECLQQLSGNVPAQAPWPAVARQPPQVRHQHRIRNPGPHELPAHRPAGPLRHRERFCCSLVNPVRSPNVHHPAPSIRQAHEVVGSMPPRSLAVMPVQPERLGRDPRHLRVCVQEDQPVPLQPRLVTDVLACRRAEVPTRKALPALGPPERTHRCRLLEPHTQQAASDRRTCTPSSRNPAQTHQDPDPRTRPRAAPPPPLTTSTLPIKLRWHELTDDQPSMAKIKLR